MIADTSPCSVERKCSSTGKLCDVDDHPCQSDAVSAGLEVTCERLDPRAFVYCPPGAQQRDSAVVWVLLVVALAIAAVGGIASYFLIFRRRPAR